MPACGTIFPFLLVGLSLTVASQSFNLHKKGGLCAFASCLRGGCSFAAPSFASGLVSLAACTLLCFCVVVFLGGNIRYQVAPAGTDAIGCEGNQVVCFSVAWLVAQDREQGWTKHKGKEVPVPPRMISGPFCVATEGSATSTRCSLCPHARKSWNSVDWVHTVVVKPGFSSGVRVWRTLPPAPCGLKRSKRSRHFLRSALTVFRRTLRSSFLE